MTQTAIRDTGPLVPAHWDAATPSPERLALEDARKAVRDAMQAAQIAAVRDVTAGMAKKDAAERHGISRPTLNEAMTWVQPWMWGQPRP